MNRRVRRTKRFMVRALREGTVPLGRVAENAAAVEAREGAPSIRVKCTPRQRNS